MQETDDLRAHLKILEGRGDARRELLRCVAHDLASPLTAMRMQLSLWQDQGIDPVGLQRMERSIEHMTRLVEDVADLAALDCEGLRMRVQRTDLADVAEEAVEAFAVQAATTDTRLRCVTRGALPAKVDRGRIVQVLDNLLRNALKFTPAGGRVTVEAWQADDGPRLTVSDSGRGLSPHDSRRLFEPYAQVQPSDGRVGTGLGLFICKRIVESHGGRIWAESEGRGKGTRFVVQLPLADARSPPGGGSMPASNGSGRPTRPGRSGTGGDRRRTVA